MSQALPTASPIATLLDGFSLEMTGKDVAHLEAGTVHDLGVDDPGHLRDPLDGDCDACIGDHSGRIGS